MALAKAAGAKIMDRDFNFLDPWGNHFEIVAYRDVQYSKLDEVLRWMGLTLETKVRMPAINFAKKALSKKFDLVPAPASRPAHFIQTYQSSPIWQSGRPAHCPFLKIVPQHMAQAVIQGLANQGLFTDPEQARGQAV
jgi:hypothetical protein